jgi:hypothetical protein
MSLGLRDVPLQAWYVFSRDTAIEQFGERKLLAPDQFL